MTSLAIGTECSFLNSAQSSYSSADYIVSLLERNPRIGTIQRRVQMNALRNNIQDIENNIWEALARDYPKFRFRRQNQTIVINEGTRVIYLNPGEIYKIKGWGVNSYYEALDVINRLQNRLWNNTSKLERRWVDDWERLGKHLNTLDKRNCRGSFEVVPGPVITLPPPCIPMPPNPPGPVFPIYPCPPLAIQPMWSSNDTRNWGLTNWTFGGSTTPGLSGVFWINVPQIRIIDGRELVYYKPIGVTSTKIAWLFHGTGESARSWFTDYEKISFVKKLLDAGYTVAAYDSYNRISRKWTLTINPATNREVLGLKAAQNFLSSINLLPVNQYGIGMASGGNMVSYAAGELGLSKVVIHNAAGVNSIIRSSSYNAQTLWMVSNNDLTFSTAEASDNYNYLATNRPALTSAFYNQQATKITSAIFDAIPGISTVVADAIISGLVSGGFIESGGALTSKFTSAGRTIREQYLQNTIPTILSTAFGADQESFRKYANDIIDQLTISFSDHKFSGWQRTESAGNLVLVDRDLAFLNA